jgi:hypothetical protein
MYQVVSHFLYSLHERNPRGFLLIYERERERERAETGVEGSEKRDIATFLFKARDFYILKRISVRSRHVI